jgi:hypothetical protein
MEALGAERHRIPAATATFRPHSGRIFWLHDEA